MSTAHLQHVNSASSPFFALPDLRSLRLQTARPLTFASHFTGQNDPRDRKKLTMSEQPLNQHALQEEENSLILQRKEKLAAERAKGNIFPNDFRRDSYCNDLQQQYADKTKEELESAAIKVKVGGRIMLNRGASWCCKT